MPHPSAIPEEEYSRRLSERETRLAKLERLHALIGSMRLAAGALFLIVAWLCAGPYSWPLPWLAIPVASFAALVFRHQRVRGLRDHARRAVAYYRTGLERLAYRWRGSGPRGDEFDVQRHLYAADLDLFGGGGLFELLCAARTPMGENTLARWLLAPAGLEVIRERHACIADLKPRLDLRESLAVHGEPAAFSVQPDKLIAWATAPNLLGRRWIRWSAPILALLAVAAALFWALSGMLFPLLAVLIAEIAVAYFLREPVHQALGSIEGAYDDLKGLSSLLERIENEHFDAAPLRALVLRLSVQSKSASVTFRRLASVVNYVESRRNPLLAPLLLLIMYPLQAALAAERWRSAHAGAVGSWLAVLGEIEALVSLARYTFERPADPFPEFIEGAAVFRAADLGHPLIAPASRVGNDVDISGATRVLLVSGSNMSGKSTLLRTVGINTVLAMAGAPVCAKRLQLTPLRVGASIRINDSLHEGSSRFYSEITRLRRLFEPASLPLLFLLDELLQGTNSADRRAGAQGVIRALIARGAIGLVSTHDLALTELTGSGGGAVENVHFQDELIGGTLKFDFKLHPGIVTKSNGIELMRSIGLDV